MIFRLPSEADSEPLLGLFKSWRHRATITTGVSGSLSPMCSHPHCLGSHRTFYCRYPKPKLSFLCKNFDTNCQKKDCPYTHPDIGKTKNKLAPAQEKKEDRAAPLGTPLTDQSLHFTCNHNIDPASTKMRSFLGRKALVPKQSFPLVGEVDFSWLSPLVGIWTVHSDYDKCPLTSIVSSMITDKRVSVSSLLQGTQSLFMENLTNNGNYDDLEEYTVYHSVHSVNLASVIAFTAGLSVLHLTYTSNPPNKPKVDSSILGPARPHCLTILTFLDTPSKASLSVPLLRDGLTTTETELITSSLKLVKTSNWKQLEEQEAAEADYEVASRKEIKETLNLIKKFDLDVLRTQETHETPVIAARQSMELLIQDKKPIEALSKAGMKVARDIAHRLILEEVILRANDMEDSSPECSTLATQSATALLKNWPDQMGTSQLLTMAFDKAAQLLATSAGNLPGKSPHRDRDEEDGLDSDLKRQGPSLPYSPTLPSVCLESRECVSDEHDCLPLLSNLGSQSSTNLFLSLTPGMRGIVRDGHDVDRSCKGGLRADMGGPSECSDSVVTPVVAKPWVDPTVSPFLISFHPITELCPPFVFSHLIKESHIRETERETALFRTASLSLCRPPIDSDCPSLSMSHPPGCLPPYLAQHIATQISKSSRPSIVFPTKPAAKLWPPCQSMGYPSPYSVPHIITPPPPAISPSWSYTIDHNPTTDSAYTKETNHTVKLPTDTVQLFLVTNKTTVVQCPVNLLLMDFLHQVLGSSLLTDLTYPLSDCIITINGKLANPSTRASSLTQDTTIRLSLLLLGGTVDTPLNTPHTCTMHCGYPCHDVTHICTGKCDAPCPIRETLTYSLNESEIKDTDSLSDLCSLRLP